LIGASSIRKTAGAASLVPLLILLVGIEAGVNAFGTLVPQIQHEFAVSAGTVAAALTVYHGIRLLINVPAGRLIARSPLTIMIAVGGGILAAGAAIVAFAPVFPLVLAGRIIMGVGSAVFFITTQFWTSKVATPENKAQLFSYNQVAALTGSAIGPAIGGVVAGTFSWRSSMILTSALGAIALLSARRLVDPSATPGIPARVPAPAGPLTINAVLGPGMIMMASFFLHTGLLAMLFPLFAAQRFGLGPAAIGGILMLGTVWRFGAALAGGKLAQWWGTRRVVITSLALMGVSILGFHLVEGPLGLIVVVSLMSWANVGGSLVVALVTDLVPEAHWGTALGLNRTLADVGAMIAPLLVGFSIDRYGFGAAINVVVGFVLISTALAAILTAPTRLGARTD
jgi:predicted MFS family arabinose efflux permease